MAEIVVTECQTAADVIRLAKEAAARRRASYERRIPIKSVATVLQKPPAKTAQMSRKGWAFPPTAAINLARQFELRSRIPRYNSREIIELLSETYGITSIDIKSQRRTRHVVHVRQLAMLLLRILTHKSFPEIGRILGGRDHTTVLHAARKFEWLRQKLRETIAENAPLSDWIVATLTLCPPPQPARTGADAGPIGRGGNHA